MPEPGHSRDADETEVAFVLAKYGGQLDRAGHRLWFTPGERDAARGRGIIHDPSGLHTWPEPDATHACMIHVDGYRDEDCSRFYIEATGVVAQIMGPSSALMTILRADPALARANGLDPADLGV